LTKEQHVFFTLALITEGTTDKVLQIIVILHQKNSSLNKNIFFGNCREVKTKNNLQNLVIVFKQNDLFAFSSESLFLYLLFHYCHKKM